VAGSRREALSRPLRALAGEGPLTVHTRRIDDPGDLLRWLPGPGAARPLALVHRGTGLVGWGEAARVTLPAGEDRFTAGEKWLHEVFDGARVRDEVGLRGTGPVSFGSFTFDPSSDGSVVIVPEVILGRDGHGNAWRTTIHAGGDAGDHDEPLPGPADCTPPSAIRWHDGSLTAPEWERAVVNAVARIGQGYLSKVVLARDLHATARDEIDERVLLRRLAARYPDCYTFACAGLVGATPELLIRRDGLRVSALVLAGTAPRGATPDEDAALAAALLSSAKNTEEHAYAAASVREVLEPLCDELTLASRPGLLRLANLHHLGTPVSGTLATPGTPGTPGSSEMLRTSATNGTSPAGAAAAAPSALSLAGALHPTAAVGGTPTEAAVELIRELEQMDRERYAGPVGWMDAEGNGEWCIALRCAQISGATARLFAGCGIVAGSDPAVELAETQVKFRPMQAALEP
jgi:menaquinone-specific isochorismate synthase